MLFVAVVVVSVCVFGFACDGVFGCVVDWFVGRHVAVKHVADAAGVAAASVGASVVVRGCSWLRMLVCVSFDLPVLASLVV